MVPLAYILAGVLVGIILLIIIAVAIFMYHRKKQHGSDSGSEDSSTTINKKRDGSPDIKIEYKGRESSVISHANVLSAYVIISCTRQFQYTKSAMIYNEVKLMCMK